MHLCASAYSIDALNTPLIYTINIIILFIAKHIAIYLYMIGY